MVLSRLSVTVFAHSFVVFGVVEHTRLHCRLSDALQHVLGPNGWRRGVVVTALVVSTKLLYVEPG